MRIKFNAEHALKVLDEFLKKSYLNDGDCRHVSSSAAPKQETVAFDMHVGQAIGHEKDRRGVSRRSRGARSLFWSVVAAILAGAFFVGIVPEFYFAEKGFGVASLVCGRLSLISILFGDNCVSSWRQDEKVRYHGADCDSIQKWIQTRSVMVFWF